MPHDRMLASRKTHTWIQKYIFPGRADSVDHRDLRDHLSDRPRYEPSDMVSLRADYAETLRLWREQFMQRRRTLSHMGFDEVFSRMWELYLAYSEAGFRSGYLDVYQWTFVVRRSGHDRRLRDRFRRVGRGAARRVRGHLRHRPAHRPLQRRRRGLGAGLHRRRGGRRDSRPRRPDPPVAAAGAGRDLGVCGSAGTSTDGRRARARIRVTPTCCATPASARSFAKSSSCRASRPGSSRCRCSSPRSCGPTPRPLLAVTVAGVAGVAGRASSSKPSATVNCGRSNPTRHIAAW